MLAQVEGNRGKESHGLKDEEDPQMTLEILWAIAQYKWRLYHLSI